MARGGPLDASQDVRPDRSAGKRMAMAQACEAGEIAIASDELATVLNRERGVVSIGDELATCTSSDAELAEQLPVLDSGREQARVRASA